MPASKKTITTRKSGKSPSKLIGHRQTKKPRAKQTYKLQKHQTQRTNTQTRKRKEVLEIPASDIEQLLVERIARNESELRVPRKALFIPEIIYSSTPGLRELAYTNGISAGRMIHERSDKTMNALLATLEQAGLGKVLQHMFENTGVITARPNVLEPNIKERIHSYEAGILAGFLGASTSQPINVSETHCIYDGNEMCQFKITGLVKYEENNNYSKSEQVLESIVKGIRNKNHNGYVSEEYYLSYMLPLTNMPISEEVSKLMYLAGKSISSGKAQLNDDTMGLIKESFGLRSVKMQHQAKSKLPKSITVEYSALNSNSQFLSFSQAFMHGLIDGLGKVQASSHVELGRGNNYILFIQLNPVK